MEIKIENHECVKANIGNPHLLIEVSDVENFNLIDIEIFCYNKLSQQLSWNEDINMKIINKKECYHLNEILDDDFFNNRKNGLEPLVSLFAEGGFGE